MLQNLRWPKWRILKRNVADLLHEITGIKFSRARLESKPKPIPAWIGPCKVAEPEIQTQSHFFNDLPPEIRGLIYKHCFGPSLIHIYEVNGRLTHVTCQYWSTNENWSRHAHCIEGDSVAGTGSQYRLAIKEDEDPNDQLISLILACRQTYNEALPFMLKTPIFTFNNPHHIFVFHRARLGTLNEIRNMIIIQDFPFSTRFEGARVEGPWVELCNAIASMKRLSFVVAHLICNTRICKVLGKLEALEQQKQSAANALLKVLKTRQNPLTILTPAWSDEYTQDIDYREYLHGVGDDIGGREKMARRVQENWDFAFDEHVQLAMMKMPVQYRTSTRWMNKYGYY